MEPSLLEREAPLQALRTAVERAASGRGGVLLLEGPAGIGKTALLDRVPALAAAHGARTLGARAAELDRGFAFGVVHQLVEPAWTALGEADRARVATGAASLARRVLEPAAGAPGAEVEHATLNGLYWLLANLADDEPLVLRVDDLHWVDEASARFLEFLGRRIDELPIVVVASLRPNEPGAPSELLGELAAGPAAQVVRLGPLSAGAVATLVQDALGGGAVPAFTAAAHRATDGNPLLVAILVQEARRAALRGREDEIARLLDLASEGVAPVIARRLRAVGPDAAAAARALAVAGERASLADVADLAGLDPERTRAAVGVLREAELLAPAGWGFTHPLVADAVLRGVPRSDRSGLHRHAARLLRARGARASEVAVHRLAADPEGDPEAVADLRAAAAGAAAEGATGTALELLRRAVQEPPPATLRGIVELELGERALHAHHPDAMHHLERALEAGLGPEEAARARAARAFVLLHTDPAAALREAERARAETTDPRLDLRLESFLLESLVFVDGFAEERERRFAAGAAAAEPSPVMLAHLALQASCAGAPPAETLTLSRRALADGRLIDAVGPAGSTWNLLTHAHRFAEDVAGTEQLLRQADAHVRSTGDHLASIFVNQSWGYWHRDFGSIATGAARAQLGLDAIRRLDLEMTERALAAITAENLVLLDRLDEAAEAVDVPLGACEGTFVEPYVRSARALVRTWRRDVAGAEEDLRRTLASGDLRGWRSPFATRARLRLATLLATHGDRDEARALADHDVAVARAAGTDGALGAALRARATTTDGDERIEALREAVAILDGGPMRLEAAWARLDLGGALRRAGHRADARDALLPALDLAAAAEATLLARLVRDELEAAGARPRRERLSGVEALTPSERRAADLAAEGLTNRQIAEELWVTRKTVEHHLGQAYAKLGIRSRAALAAALGREAPATAARG
ncbi:AAA family ATPase [Patulibacter brassicae]|jgi:DNA-binding CsgD family transcriptional regulator|uniref:AAA family ATPase n=1 Tax=Patulibacter brassicae TaxID=1705717 RepID=A0ABU4VKC5_9ACTN|nr:AAA family ATPase [Patulibacter brassicae]MDX8151802.1 AAA family ATPase [Patulibacter brassicae]